LLDSLLSLWRGIQITSKRKNDIRHTGSELCSC
jgi:hypothetical protein